MPSKIKVKFERFQNIWEIIILKVRIYFYMFLLLTLTKFRNCSGVSLVGFEQANAGLGGCVKYPLICVGDLDDWSF